MSGKDFNHELFNDELSVLKNAERILENSNLGKHELLQEYRKMVKQYKRLLKFASKIINISDAQGRDLKKREMQIKNILNNSDQGFLTFGKDLIVKNEYSLECINIFQQKIGGMNILKLIESENKEQNQLFAEVFNEVFQAAENKSLTTSLEKLPDVIKINEKFINVKYNIIRTEESGDNEEINIMLVLTNITDKQKAEDKVAYLSFHDKLTGLYNRAYFDNIVQQLVSQNSIIGVILADMNGLKLVNDVFGHESGDNLLQATANVLLSSCRNEDIVVRWGGDEFLVVLPGASKNACDRVAARIKEKCRENNEGPIDISLALGTATTVSDSTEPYELVGIAENRMYNNKLSESTRVRQKLVLDLKEKLEANYPGLVEHVARVEKASRNLADCLNLEARSLEAASIHNFVNLHDIGKVAIPEYILNKPGALTQKEWETMKQYTEIGFRMAQSINEPFIAETILALRENWDGTGYPRGLKGEEIPVISRIVSIVESYDVMVNGTCYRQAVNAEQAVKELKRCSGTQFDPNLVKLFLNNSDKILKV
ncbi:MAG: HD-GYP domain-containing protein [bacterium]